MAKKRLHFRDRIRGSRTTKCGRRDNVARTDSIESVTCQTCLKRLWEEISLAYQHAFPHSPSRVARSMRRTLREAEREVRVGPLDPRTVGDKKG